MAVARHQHQPGRARHSRHRQRDRTEVELVGDLRVAQQKPSVRSHRASSLVIDTMVGAVTGVVGKASTSTDANRSSMAATSAVRRRIALM